MNRKYLDDIGMVDRLDTGMDDDLRQERWQKQREIYGFDDRETWSLDCSFYCWLYERLKMYLEVATIIDLTHHKFEYEGETLTQEECIHRMLKGCEIYFKQEDSWNVSKEDWKMINDVAYIWALVLPTMWW